MIQPKRRFLVHSNPVNDFFSILVSDIQVASLACITSLEHTRTSTRAQFYEKTLEMADLITDPDNPRSGRHRELEKAEISKSEQAVVRVIDAVKNLSFTNPFTIADKEQLYCLASGAPVPLDVQTDVLQAEAIGKDAKGDFVDVLN